MVTYVYFRMPSNFDVHIITLLSADPEAKRLPRSIFKKKMLTFILNRHFPVFLEKWFFKVPNKYQLLLHSFFLSVLSSSTLESGIWGLNPSQSGIEYSGLTICSESCSEQKIK